MKKKIFFVISFVFLVKQCFAHNVGYLVFKNGIGIKVFYEDINKTPMSYAEVKVYSPEDKKTEYQSGITDKNGCFVFCPDRPGKWRIEVNDGMGHGVVKELEILENFTIQMEDMYQLSLWKKVLVGISTIFGFSGILFYILTIKKLKSNAHS